MCKVVYCDCKVNEKSGGRAGKCLLLNSAFLIILHNLDFFSVDAFERVHVCTHV